MQFTTVFSDCQTTNAAKQMMTRTTSFSGLFETFGTVGAGYAKNGNSGDSVLWNALTNIMTKDTCALQAMAAGLIVSNMLNYQTPDEVFYKEVNFSLLDQLNGV